MRELQEENGRLREQLGDVDSDVLRQLAGLQREHLELLEMWREREAGRAAEAARQAQQAQQAQQANDDDGGEQG